MRYLLDTNICIYLIKNKFDSVRRHFAAWEIGDIGVSSITVAELQVGVQKSRHVTQNIQALSQFLLPLIIADFDAGAAAVYGQVRADLEKRGVPIGALDTLIAAHALSLGVTLVTNNTKEFARVNQLKSENWVEE